MEDRTSIDIVTHQCADDVADVPHLFHSLTLPARDSQKIFVRLGLGL